jgi:hypothetical protein
MPTAGNVPAAKIANCHTHPVALLPKSSMCNRSADAKYENGERDPHYNFCQLVTEECLSVSRSRQNDSGSR